MNEPTGKTAALCLAITENKPHRPGGCVGIFFQLFDWNRRFAKKKLFSRKLLPPARAKQASKKFGGDEKMPKSKLHLIADENTGGFPIWKKNVNRIADNEQKHEVRSPGLIARLMGLESMPAVQRDKPKKTSIPTSDVKEEKFVNIHSGLDRGDVSLDKGNAKLESRPQKLQKTGQFDRRAVSKLGAETLQIKSVLSRSRKHHHPRLTSPVKSPRISSSKSASRTSRWIDAATRILEPGLQATNRSKCALTYSSSVQYSPKEEIMMEAMEPLSPDVAKQSGCDGGSVSNSLIGQTSCKNCGNLLDVMGPRTNLEEQPFVRASTPSNLISPSLQGLEMSKTKPSVVVVDQEREIDYQRCWEQPVYFIAHKQTLSEPAVDRKPVSLECQSQWTMANQQNKPQKEESSTIAFNRRTQTQNQMALSRDRIPPKAKVTNLQNRRVSSTVNAVSGPKDFVALNRSLSGCTRPRVPVKPYNSTSQTERKFCNRGDGSLPQLRTPVRKRRTLSVNGQAESNGSVNSALLRSRNVRCDGVTGKEMRYNADSMDQICGKSKSTSCADGNITSGNKSSDVISFAFSSPMKQKSRIPTDLKEKRKDQNDWSIESASQQGKLILDENYGRTSLRNQLQLRGDALGALLEQKLKELTAQEEDELTTEGTPPKRSTAMILQELISALSAEQPISVDGCRMLNTDVALQTKAKTEGTSVRFSHDSDHLSPGSVLEASFSNDSCVSSSLDDSSGHRLYLDYMDYSCEQRQPPESDADLLDSATSVNQGGSCIEILNEFVDHISWMLNSSNLASAGLTGSKLKHAKETILNTELLFGSVALHGPDGAKPFLLTPFILGEFEAFGSEVWINLNSLLGFEENKEEGNRLKEFAFDCLIECLDSKYGRFCCCGFKAWTRRPSYTNAKRLVQEVGEQVRRWTHFAGMAPDELIEWDMSHSLGTWTDFDVEAFETGTELDWDILQILVEEVVSDIWAC